jgi:sulfur-carrier protein adenylyltransferase/sulfurtransferase
VIWYFENLQRYRQEREALEALASTADWLTPIAWRIDASLRMIWDADISVSERTFPISLRYPNHFPHSPPMVLPRGDTERWSSHQYGPGGELCLEHGPDNWHQDITGADMILSAYRLLQGERPASDQQGTVASRHRTTVGQDLRNKHSRFMVTAALAEFLRSIPDGVMLPASVNITFHEEAFVYVLSSATMPDGKKWVEPNLPAPLLFEGYEQPTVLFRWPGNVLRPSLESLTKFRADVASQGFVLPSVKYALLAHNSRVCICLLDADDDTVSTLSVIPAPAMATRLDESHAILATRKVAIVGCGSLGSKVGAMMARSGVGKFLLVDDDLLFPHNLVRHDLDWRDVGTHKVDSVARKIQLVNAAATCEKRKHKLGGQESSGAIESLIEGLADCDLIIDATADPSVFNYLTATVVYAKRPLLWAEVFGGGFGGLIARHRPLLEPDPASMRRAIESWCFDRGKPIERAGADYGGGPAVPLIADDADVTVIASHAARMGIDMLIPRNPSLFPNSVYMIGLAEGWIFERPFETYPIDVGPPAALGSSAVMDPDERAGELKRIFQLFEEHQHAASSADPDRQTPST